MPDLLATKTPNIDVLNNPLLKQLSWAFYLACSWTWCIGMFLPVILQKDFGNGAWFFFIIFNIVGATAFVFFIRNKNESNDFIKNNNMACVLFSVVTILFQLFFIGWTSSYFSFIEIIISLLVMTGLYFMVRYAGFGVTAAIVWFVSLVAFIGYESVEPNDTFAVKITNQLTHFDPSTLCAIPLLMLGFLLCPYLDLTFHHVVQADQHNNHNGNRLSFLIGFPLLFGILMLFSLMYIDTAEQMLFNSRQISQESVIIIKALFFYFITQAWFTILAHWYQIYHKIEKPVNLAFYLFSILSVALPFFLKPSFNEVGYRCFMAFYGIIAPSYVFLVAFNKHEYPKKIMAIGITVSLLLSAIPMFFPSNQNNYLYLLAVAVVIFMRFVKNKK